MDELMLPVTLQNLAQRYIAARRRSGEALLDAARALAEARSAVQHGEWYAFLKATNTTPATAERLLNIHQLASENLQFAGFVTDNWIGQSAAALLARPSTPQAARDAILSSGTPPSVADVQEAIKAAQPMTADEARAAEARILEGAQQISLALKDCYNRLTPEQFKGWVLSEVGMSLDEAFEYMSDPGAALMRMALEVETNA